MAHPAHLQVHPRRWLGRAAIRAVCLALMLGLLGLFAAGVPARARQLSSLAGNAELIMFPGMPPPLTEAYALLLGPAEAQALGILGFSLNNYASAILFFEIGLALVCAAVALLIFWQRSAGWLTLWVSLVLMLLGTTVLQPEAYMLTNTWLGWELFPVGLGLLGLVSFLHILYLAPDGRFVPHWTGRLAAGFTGSVLALAAFTATIGQRWNPLVVLVFFIAVIGLWLLMCGVGIASQVYRYRHVSGPVQRQQIKWVVAGLAAVTVGILVNASLLYTSAQSSGLERVLANLARTPLVSLCLISLPLSLAFSILRYRLWDIDLIIRRTLIYASLTAALAVVYLSSIILLQAFVGGLTGQSQSELVTVLSTLAIAALFVPLRRRMQAFIDRRFYRRKYDAAQVLAAFGGSLRDETDLARLSQRLVSVVHQTMQPDSASLWLRPPKG